MTLDSELTLAHPDAENPRTSRTLLEASESRSPRSVSCGAAGKLILFFPRENGNVKRVTMRGECAVPGHE